MSKNALRKHLEDLAIAQGKIPGRKKPAKAASPVKKATLNNQPSPLDAVSLSGTRLSINLDGATLMTNNVLLRIGDLLASSYRRSWTDRLGALRLQNAAVWRAWERVVTYPILIDAVYCVPHGALMDRDGLTASLKYPIDALRDTGLIQDDSPQYVAQVLPFQFAGRPSSLHLQLRPSPSPYGCTDAGWVESVLEEATA